ncbi:hypothetical protein Taro_037476 [Colocasia esculenta]|uniref:Uncharacterized protein n=1 Tax=Colocasia esculenta TaxID=4460 RepID=A0A843W496_COLES|nr:hypothetical protein [Colocasia esculenta]
MGSDLTGGSLAVCTVGALLLYAAARLWWALWGRPKSIERELRRQGIPNTIYGLFNTDLKDEAVGTACAWSSPSPTATAPPNGPTHLFNT